MVLAGLRGADIVVAPSAWMLDQILRSLWIPGRARRGDFPGARNPIFFNPYVSKEDSVLAVGSDGGRGQTGISADSSSRTPCPCVSSARNKRCRHRGFRFGLTSGSRWKKHRWRFAAPKPRPNCGRFIAVPRSTPRRRATIHWACLRLMPRCRDARLLPTTFPASAKRGSDAALYFRTNDARASHG